MVEPCRGKAARALGGIINVGAVDADAHGELGSQFGIQGKAGGVGHLAKVRCRAA